MTILGDEPHLPMEPVGLELAMYRGPAFASPVWIKDTQESLSHIFVERRQNKYIILKEELSRKWNPISPINLYKIAGNMVQWVKALVKQI